MVKSLRAWGCLAVCLSVPASAAAAVGLRRTQMQYIRCLCAAELLKTVRLIAAGVGSRMLTFAGVQFCRGLAVTAAGVGHACSLLQGFGFAGVRL